MPCCHIPIKYPIKSAVAALSAIASRDCIAMTYSSMYFSSMLPFAARRSAIFLNKLFVILSEIIELCRHLRLMQEEAACVQRHQENKPGQCRCKYLGNCVCHFFHRKIPPFLSSIIIHFFTKCNHFVENSTLVVENSTNL